MQKQLHGDRFICTNTTCPLSFCSSWNFYSCAVFVPANNSSLGGKKKNGNQMKKRNKWTKQTNRSGRKSVEKNRWHDKLCFCVKVVMLYVLFSLLTSWCCCLFFPSTALLHFKIYYVLHIKLLKKKRLTPHQCEKMAWNCKWTNIEREKKNTHTHKQILQACCKRYIQWNVQREVLWNSTGLTKYCVSHY